MADDPRIAEFARSGRHRRAIASLVLGLMAVLGGAILLYVLLASDTDLANTGGMKQGGGYQLIVLAGGAIAVGLGAIGFAIKTARGKDDV